MASHDLIYLDNLGWLIYNFYSLFQSRATILVRHLNLTPLERYLRFLRVEIARFELTQMKLLHWDLVRNLLRSASLLLFLLLNWIILCDLRVLSWLLYPQLSSFLNFLLNLSVQRF